MKASPYKRQGWSRETWKVKRALDRNRALLKALRTRDCQAHEGPNEWLSRRGFDFQFHTHVTTTEKGQLAVMCFDKGYVLEEGAIVPYSPQSNLAPSPLGRIGGIPS